MSEEITDLMPVAEILAAPFAEFVSYHTKQGDSYNFIIKLNRPLNHLDIWWLTETFKLERWSMDKQGHLVIWIQVKPK